MGKPRAFTDEQERDQIAPKYQGGALLCDLAAEYGVNTTTIVRALNRVGVSRRKAAPRTGIPRPRPAARLFNEEQERSLAKRYEDGALVAELAKEMGASNKAVNNALRRQGVPLRDRKEAGAHLVRRRRALGQKHPNFKGGRSKAANDYMQVAIDEDDPMWAMATQRGRVTDHGYGYVLEHRLVMARHLGRPLETQETVHHKNGKRDDNRLSNLELWSSRHAKGQRVEDLRRFAKEILALYPD